MVATRSAARGPALVWSKAASPGFRRAKVSRFDGPESPPLVNPLTLDIQGDRVAPDACEYTLSLELAPGQTAVREDVVEDTHTYYERNNAYGKANGNLVGTVSARKSGGCTGR
jgi:hypothetical protein